ncbi:MAG TPA: hypothetical protein VFA24_07485 [Gaiellaceae bacterium]|nr:hypothetical protein [Gaiellaceae bacterium]
MSRSRELWGYGVWGLAGAVIAGPELWAAVEGDASDWPTISGTVGYLEYWHPWVAVVVLGTLVWAAFHAVRYEAERAAAETPETSLRRTGGGRMTMADDVRGLNAVAYFVVAFAALAGAVVWSYADRPHDRYRLGEVLYGGIAVLLVAGPSLLALLAGRDVPFPTLFATVQALERRVRAVAVVVSAGIAVLLVHLALYPWPAVIPDLQDLHAKRIGYHVRKQNEPPVDVP